MRAHYALLLTLVVPLGCSATVGHIRKVTYPPGFAYLERSEIKTEMEKLAVGVLRLDRVLRAGPTEHSVDRDQVLKLLTEIDKAAAELDLAGTGHNHPLIHSGIQPFRKDIAAAQAAAEFDPPNYYLAGAVAGACGYCHR